MEAKALTLSNEEYRTVMAMEQYWRAYYKIQGDSADSDRIITSLMGRIQLACGGHPSAERFFELLEQDSRKINFYQVYEAGKECFEKGIPLQEGFQKLLRDFSLDPKKAAFEAEFQNCYNELIGQMPTLDLKSLPNCLLVEYRHTYSDVNNHIEEFFQMGYDAANPGHEQRGGTIVPAPPRLYKGGSQNARKETAAVRFV